MLRYCEAVIIEITMILALTTMVISSDVEVGDFIGTSERVWFVPAFANTNELVS